MRWSRREREREKKKRENGSRHALAHARWVLFLFLLSLFARVVHHDDKIRRKRRRLLMRVTTLYRDAILTLKNRPKERKQTDVFVDQKKRKKKKSKNPKRYFLGGTKKEMNELSLGPTTPQKRKEKKRERCGEMSRTPFGRSGRTSKSSRWTRGRR